MSTLHELHRPLGSTGFQVSPLGLGTVKLGRDQGVKYPNGFTIPDDAQALALLQQARELGINLIDTAPAYGISEQRLGPLLRGQRDEWVIVSKTGEEFEQGRSHFDFSPAHTRLSVEGGLLALEQGDCAMVTYNLSEQGEKPVLDYAASHAKGILIKKALASGHACLADGVDPVRASFELIFAHPGVSSAIVGTITPAHLAANVATVAAVLQGIR